MLESLYSMGLAPREFPSGNAIVLRKPGVDNPGHLTVRL